MGLRCRGGCERRQARVPQLPKLRAPSAAHSPIATTLALQIEKGVCEREFQQLRTCWARAFRAALARTK